MKRIAVILGMMFGELCVILLSVQLIRIFLEWEWSNALSNSSRIIATIFFWTFYGFLMYFLFKFATRFIKKDHKHTT
jgi:hypothetical protein